MKRPRVPRISAVWVILALGAVLGAHAMTLRVLRDEEQCVMVAAEKGNVVSGTFEVVSPASVGESMVFLRSPPGPTGRLLFRATSKRESWFQAEVEEDDAHFELCFIYGKTAYSNKIRNAALHNKKRTTWWERNQKKKHDHMADATDSSDSNSAEDPSDTDDDLQNTGMTDTFYRDPYDLEEDDTQLTFGFGLRVIRDKLKIKELDAANDKEEQEKAELLTEEANQLWAQLWHYIDHEGYVRDREAIHGEEMSKTRTRIVCWKLFEAAVLLYVSCSQIFYIRRFFETKRVL